MRTAAGTAFLFIFNSSLCIINIGFTSGTVIHMKTDLKTRPMVWIDGPDPMMGKYHMREYFGRYQVINSAAHSSPNQRLKLFH